MPEGFFKKRGIISTENFVNRTFHSAVKHNVSRESEHYEIRVFDIRCSDFFFHPICVCVGLSAVIYIFPQIFQNAFHVSFSVGASEQGDGDGAVAVLSQWEGKERDNSLFSGIGVPAFSSNITILAQKLADV